jgi:putative transcriptional regulator
MRKDFVLIAAAIIVILMTMVLDMPLIGMAFSGQHEMLLPSPFHVSPSSPSRSGSEAALAKGRLLVASRHLMDPNFSETVVLLIDYARNGAMGLVINRPTEVKLSAVFPEMEGLQQRTDTIYMGGPVGRNQILMLIRSSNQSEESRRIFEDIYVSSSLTVLEQMIDDAGAEKRFRVYAGYAGWAPGQLDHEVSRGDWYVLPADAETVFEKTPSDIWRELILRSAVEWVKLGE